MRIQFKPLKSPLKNQFEVETDAGDGARDVVDISGECSPRQATLSLDFIKTRETRWEIV